jgi:hypothetical protein
MRIRTAVAAAVLSTAAVLGTAGTAAATAPRCCTEVETEITEITKVNETETEIDADIRETNTEVEIEDVINDSAVINNGNNGGFDRSFNNVVEMGDMELD